MREIKFRAWDKNGAPDGGGTMNYGGFEIHATGKVTVFEPFVSDDIIIMQYTGLKDKNDTEIYEGDIVRSYSLVGEIVGRLGSFGIHANPQDFLTLHDIWDRGDGHRIEILGNKYANPDLCPSSP